MKATILILSSLLFIFMYQAVPGDRPVKIFHGLGRSCKDEDELPDNFECVETGYGTSSFVKSIEDQAMKGCIYLQKEIDKLRPSFYVIGYSQGGLIARWIQLNCLGVAPLIKRMILIGTPNLGVDKFPESDAYIPKIYTKNEIDHLIETNEKWLDISNPIIRQSRIDQLYEKTIPIEEKPVGSFYDAGIKIFQSMKSFCKFLNLGPFNYLNKKPRYSTFIEEISKENEIGNLNTLDLFVIIANRDERIVIPPESVTFGINILDEEGNTIPNPQTSNFIKEHFMIDDLWWEEKLLICLSDSSHSGIDPFEFTWINLTLLNEDSEKDYYEASAKAMKNEFLKRYPNYCTYNEKIGNPKMKQYYEKTNGNKGVSNIEFIWEKILI